MGEGDPRSTRRASQPIVPAARVTARADEAAERPSDRPLLPRTATLDDPLTTSLLAEVTRQAQTIEVSPEQIDEARELAGPGDPERPGGPR